MEITNFFVSAFGSSGSQLLDVLLSYLLVAIFTMCLFRVVNNIFYKH